MTTGGAGTDTGTTDTSGQSDGGGDANATDASSTTGDSSGILSGVVSSLIAPVKAIVDEIEAKSSNTLNQILNTVFYSGLALSGVVMMAIGFVLLFKEAGGDASVGGVMSAGGKVKNGLLNALFVAEPEIGVPAKAAGVASAAARPGKLVKSGDINLNALKGTRS